MSDDSEFLVITLTARPPVRIKLEDWPLVAEAEYDKHDGKIRSQANRSTNIKLRVRKHADGRVLVYATYLYDTCCQGEHNRSFKVGKLYSEADLDLPEAIRDVGVQLRERLDNHGIDSAHVRDLIDECIADLPAEDI